LLYLFRHDEAVQPAALTESVEQPTRFCLSFYRGTTGTLGLSIPPGLLARADDVIE
jgi:hypothetical protein